MLLVINYQLFVVIFYPKADKTDVPAELSEFHIYMHYYPPASTYI